MNTQKRQTLTITTLVLISTVCMLPRASAQLANGVSYGLPDGQTFRLTTMRTKPAAGGRLLFVNKGQMPYLFEAFTNRLSGSLCASSSYISQSRFTIRPLTFKEKSGSSTQALLISAEAANEQIDSVYDINEDKNEDLIFCEGSEITFKGDVAFGNISIASDITDPLRIKIVRDAPVGYRYVTGKGCVTIAGVETNHGGGPIIRQSATMPERNDASGKQTQPNTESRTPDIGLF